MSSDQAVVPALLPRGGGHQFVFYGDCCSGAPGAPGEANFAAVNNVLRRLNPMPEFICFLGDHIMGADSPSERGVLLSQWRYWLDHEMAWLDPAIPLYHTTSNHNTPDAVAEAVWREVFPHLPQDAPPGQAGLSYAVRHGDLLLVCTNSAFSGLGGVGHVEHEWLDRVLSDNADAAYKFVAGHYPVHAVNGYTDYPTWRIVPDQGRAFWDVLVRHRVMAYLCSHVIAFDVQVHGGVLQILTGGAGTNYGPGGFMPGQTEYLHAVQAAVDPSGFRFQVLDPQANVRESLSWPFEPPNPEQWQPIQPGVTDISSYAQRWAGVTLWRFRGACPADAPPEAQTLLCAWSDLEGPPICWIGLEQRSLTLSVHLAPEAGGGEQIWHGPDLAPGQPFDVQVAIHTGMGPGGVLWRRDDQSPWSSMRSTSARGAERATWPEYWALGHSQSGPSDRPFLGSDLQAEWASVLL